MTQGTVSKQARSNWLIDAAVFTGGLIAAITGIYFLFLPSGGCQGGRNPMYGVWVVFGRQTWDDPHTWFGALMIAAVILHLAVHRSWVKGTMRRMARSLAGKGSSINRRGYFNTAVNATIALSFLLTAASGIYFMFVPGGRWATDLVTADTVRQSRGGLSNETSLGENGGGGRHARGSAVEGPLGGQVTGQVTPLPDITPEDWLTVTGKVVSTADGLIEIETDVGEVIPFDGRPLSYAAEQGFAPELGDAVNLSGFQENGAFTIGKVTNLRDGATVVLRDVSGRPGWAGRGRRG
jgi:hypothetical protein